MTSTAISAQGTTFKIGTGSGSAKTISAVTAGYPTIITATAHGLAAGTVAALAGITGAAGLLASFPIKNITTNTFAVDFDSTGLTLGVSSATATPATSTQIKNGKTFTGFDGKPSEIDTSNLDSVAKEFRLGLVDNGQFSYDVDWDGTDPGQLACKAAQTAIPATLCNFTLKLPGTIGTTASFTAFVTSFPVSGGVDQVVKSTITFRISGAVTWA